MSASSTGASYGGVVLVGVTVVRFVGGTQRSWPVFLSAMATLESRPPPPPATPPEGLGVKGFGIFLCCTSDGMTPRKRVASSADDEATTPERQPSCSRQLSEERGATSEYVGDRLADGSKHGVGRMTYASGEVYEGEWADDLPHGAGKYTFSSGSVYEGEHVNGKANGAGSMTFASGSTCVGQWREDRIHGRATFTKANGQVYDGHWVDDKKHGRGTQTFSTGSVYDGCLLYTSPSPRDRTRSRMPSSA